VANPRGRGLMCAFDLPTAELRNAVRHRAYDLGLIILGCGANTLRFRPALTVTEADIDAGLAILEQAIKETV
ncbi:MAG: aminotransferase class III-fold pyridoxal phosphate-dependent enzyme, partial [Bacteroidota bacterium]